jgi:D-beta-D-heptose 7-phosphate kinase / D-beta-D-heptose 1-phosphate adenosyltransferase
VSDRRLLIVGDVLLDRDLTGTVERVSPDAPVPVVDLDGERRRPGGAGLAAWFAADDGLEVTLVTAIAQDEAGAGIEDALTRRGVRVVAGRRRGATPEKIRVRSGGQSLVRLDRGDAGPVEVEAPDTGDMGEPDAVLVSDYGGGVTHDGRMRSFIQTMVRRSVPTVWDPHPRGGDPMRGCTVVTPNRREAIAAAPTNTASAAGYVSCARSLRSRWDARAVAITMGDQGALLVDDDGPLMVSAPSTPFVVDVCGSGDRFAVATAVALAEGLRVRDAVEGAVNAASAAVARDGIWETATAPVDGPRPARRREVVTVATSGCFDLLHAGHVRMLRSARQLGDRLVVCLNDDASVRRLKGEGRPLVPATERAELLLALECVDEVVIFSEDTPVRALERIRPQILAKGADYTIDDLPEARVVQRWGGETIILPYVEGRSTTDLIVRSRPLAAG